MTDLFKKLDRLNDVDASTYYWIEVHYDSLNLVSFNDGKQAEVFIGEDKVQQLKEYIHELTTNDE